MGKKSGGHHHNQKRESSPLTSTTSLGKRRRLDSDPGQQGSSEQQARGSRRGRKSETNHSQKSNSPSTMSNPKTADYGSQASPLRVPSKPTELTKVAIIGAAGGIGQPLSMLLMMHSEYIQHIALYDLVHVHGLGLDVSHIDRQCKVTTHLGPDELGEAVKDAKVIVIPAGLAQKPGMSRDDLFGSNSTIMGNIARVCATVNPNAMLAIISNPVNSLVPLTCEVYSKVLSQTGKSRTPESPEKSTKSSKSLRNTRTLNHANFEDVFRRIFGVTTLDVVRASTLTAKSAFFKPESNGLFKDPSKISVPVVGGHAGRTIMPLLSQATPKIDRKRLEGERANTHTLVESIQQAGIEVLNAKKGAGSATLAMAYAACRFTISLLRAQAGESNIVECAYVRHREPYVEDLDYFACPLLLGKDGYVRALPLGKLLPYEEKMIEEGCKELRTSVAKGEDFAKEHLN